MGRAGRSEAAGRGILSRSATGAGMSRPADPWHDVSVLLVDGNNLLHAVAGDPGPGPLRSLLARLAAAVPRVVDATVVLDGTPDPGAPARTRIRAGLLVRHAGRVEADALLVQMVEARPFLERAGVVVVTNDAILQGHVRRAGGRCRPVGWLEAQLTGRPQAATAPGTSIGGSRPPRRAEDRPDDRDGEDDRRPWRPGRGATRKRGNPRRGRGDQRSG